LRDVDHVTDNSEFVVEAALKDAANDDADMNSNPRMK